MRLFKSFKYAFEGITYCIINEKNMRIHTVAALYVLFFSSFFNLTKEKFVFLLLTIAIVIISEMFNTSIEKLGDMYTEEFNSKLKIAKDVAAGAVSFSAFFAIVIAFILFWDINAIKRIYIFFANDLLKLVILILTIIFSLVYIKIDWNKIFKKKVGNNFGSSK